jgi:hypothetical protein
MIRKRWLAVAVLLAMGAVAGGAQKQRYGDAHHADPMDYPLTVHVTHARVVTSGGVSVLHLDAVIEGKKIELESGASGLLHIGDYRGRLATNSETKSGWFSRSYDLLFSDGTHVIFNEVAESE